MQIKLCFAKTIAENIHRENYHGLLETAKTVRVVYHIFIFYNITASNVISHVLPGGILPCGRRPVLHAWE